jgi:hypothetical protein
MRRVEICIKIYNVISSVLYGCEIWSRTLKEEHKLKVSENKMPRKRFVMKGSDVNGV